jgi:hypothetical protein
MTPAEEQTLREEAEQRRANRRGSISAAQGEQDARVAAAGSAAAAGKTLFSLSLYLSFSLLSFSFLSFSLSLFLSALFLSSFVLSLLHLSISLSLSIVFLLSHTSTPNSLLFLHSLNTFHHLSLPNTLLHSTLTPNSLLFLTLTLDSSAR